MNKKIVTSIIIAFLLIASFILNITLAVSLHNISKNFEFESSNLSFYLKEIRSWYHAHDEPDPYFEGYGFVTCNNSSKVFLQFPPSENSVTFTVSEKINDLSKGNCTVNFREGFGSQHFSVKLHYSSKSEWNGKTFYEVHLEGLENIGKSVWILP